MCTFRLNEMHYSAHNKTNYIERLRNQNTNHIPSGFYNGLSDTHMDNVRACDDEAPFGCGAINDQISCVSIHQMYQLLTPNVASPLAFKNKLNESMNSTQQTLINNLYNSYF